VTPRKNRIPVVFDTNVFIRFFLNPHRETANNKVVKLWFAYRELQLIVSVPVVEEYTEILARLGVEQRRIEHFTAKMQLDTVTWVNLGKRHRISRDADDNVMIDTARSGNAKYIISHDKDLLDIPAEDLRGVRCQIVKPPQLLIDIVKPKRANKP